MADPRNVPRVLIVDDDPQIGEMIQEILQMANCEVLEARSGEEALEVLRRENRAGRPVDILLLDILMPGISGYEVISRVKSDPDLTGTSIIVTTALSSIADKTLGLGMGADDYLTKPFDPRELLARIQVIMRIRRTEQSLRERNRELALLNEISRTIISSLELEEVLNAMMEGVQRMFPVVAGALVLLDEDVGGFAFRRTIREHPLMGKPLPPGTSILGHVVTSGTPYLASDVAQDPLFSPLVDGGGRPVSSYLCVPLTVRERVVGALGLADKADGPFTETDRDLLQTLAGAAAVAIENAQLYAEVADYAQNLERSQAQLIQAEKMAAIGRLTASIAHEINNPLQALHNTIHLALSERLPLEKRQEYLGMAQKEVERLIGIIQRMLDFYRPSQGAAVLSDVNRILLNALAIVEKRLQHSRIQLHVRLDENLPPVLAIPDQLTQVFLNILINAVEAMPEGGDLRVGSLLTEDGRWVLVAIRDSGPGLTPDQMAHLFEPFYTTKPSGTGLGLAISYGIVERHGGTIEVSSQPGQGATFVVRLPVART
ncbi:MAG: response regulator [Thermoflexia bacterium]|nr:MAG: response regulator [Thermoflexia bacterium]